MQTHSRRKDARIANPPTLFDALEDTNADYCAALCEMIGADAAGAKDGIRIVAASVLGLALGFLLPKNGRR